MCFRLISQLSSYWKPSKGNSQRVSRGLMRFFILFCANGTFLRNSLNILPIMKLDVYKNKLLKIFQYSSFVFFVFLRHKNHDAILLFESLCVLLAISQLFPSLFQPRIAFHLTICSFIYQQLIEHLLSGTFYIALKLVV